MKVKIIKSSKPTYWYADLIGNVFNVEYFNSRDYLVINSSFESNHFIKIYDAEVLKGR